MKQVSPFVIAAFLLIAFMGFADAAYLTAKHYAGVIPPCSLVNGCETVLTSPYAIVWGNVPIALVGTLYYLLLFVAGVIYVDTKNAGVIKIAAYFTIVGFLTSAALVSLQIFVIQAICLYCIGSAATSTLLFLLGVSILRKLKTNDNIDTPEIINDGKIKTGL